LGAGRGPEAADSQGFPGGAGEGARDGSGPYRRKPVSISPTVSRWAENVIPAKAVSISPAVSRMAENVMPAKAGIYLSGRLALGRERHAGESRHLSLRPSRAWPRWTPTGVGVALARSRITLTLSPGKGERVALSWRGAAEPYSKLGEGCQPRLFTLFSATAARMSAFNAVSSIVSPSWKSMARRVLPSRLALNRRAGSSSAAPRAKVILTTLL
jgi:hypothetical protein